MGYILRQAQDMFVICHLEIVISYSEVVPPPRKATEGRLMVGLQVFLINIEK